MKVNIGLALLVIASVTALVLGTIGFHQYDPDHDWKTALYRAIQLFSLNSGVVEKPPTPVLVEWARWLALGALAGVVYATVTALMRHFRSAYSISRMRGHTIVCGAGKRGTEIVRAICRKQFSRGVVVIEIDEHNAATGELRNLGAELVHGNALDTAVLKQAGVKRAAALVAVTGSDEKNLAICSEVENGLNRGCVLSAGVESMAWRSYFLDRLRHDSRIRLDSYQSRAARNLMLEIACLAAADPEIRRRGARLLVEADGPFRQELVRAAAAVLQISGDVKPSICLTGTTAAEAGAFRESFPAASLVVDMSWHSGNANDVFSEDAETTPDFAVFARSHDAATLEAADRFLKRHEIPHTRVFACLCGEMELFKAGLIRKDERDFVIRNLFALGLGKVDPLEAEIEKDAMKCHDIYWQNEKANNPAYGKGKNDLPRDWNQLRERYRESNRLAALHHEVKRQLWKSREPGGETETLELLARCEHMRWMSEKVMDGWRWSGSPEKESRNNAKLRHHLLMPYDSLPEPERKKDYNTFLWALELAADPRQKLGLVPAAKGTPSGGYPS